MTKVIVSRASELSPGERKIVEFEGRSIGVFNVKGDYFALRNVCPHQGAPLCIGPVRGTTQSQQAHQFEYVKDGEIIVCPWHCWEFDICTGRSVFNPHRTRVKTYRVTVERREDVAEDPSVETFPVTVEDGLVVLHV